MPTVHPSAVVDPGALLHPGVVVGPFCQVGAGVELGEGCQLLSHVVLEGPTVLGPDNIIHPFASIGGPPQDKKYRGEATRLVIGRANRFREGVTINRGTVQDQGLTTVGDDNWVMAYVHIAHDCRIGNHCVLANSVNLAGHVQVGDWAVLGGYTGVHQYCRIGAHVMAGIASVVVKDVPPFLMISGNTARAFGLNLEGLRRRGFDDHRLEALQRSYRILFREGNTLEQARALLAEQEAAFERADDADCRADLGATLAFLAHPGRGIVRP